MTGALFYVDSFHEELMRADFPAGKLLGSGRLGGSTGGQHLRGWTVLLFLSSFIIAAVFVWR